LLKSVQHSFPKIEKQIPCVWYCVSTNCDISMWLQCLILLKLLKIRYSNILYRLFALFILSSQEFQSTTIWILLNKNEEERLLSTVSMTKKKRMLLEETVILLMQFDIHTCKIIKGIQSYNQTWNNVSNMLWQEIAVKWVWKYLLNYCIFPPFQLFIDIHFDFKFGCN